MFYFYGKNKLMIKITFLQASTLFTYFHCMFILHRFEKYCLKNRFISVTWHYIPNHTISLQNMLNTLWQYFISRWVHINLKLYSRPKKRRRRMDMMNMKMILRSEDSFRHFLLKACVYIGFPLYVLISVYTCTCI